MGGMSKGIDYLRLRFSEFVIVYAFVDLLWATGSES
jgi:hypothetical protein